MSYDTCIGKARELPPRTRRIPDEGRRHGLFKGTTSAHAENTGFRINPYDS